METPSGLMVSLYTTFYFKTEFFKNGLAKFCTSPIETILCLDNKQSMYCQLLMSLLGRDVVVRIGSIFASVLARSFKFLEDYWKELCSNIRTGYLSDWIIDPGCKNAISSILTGPNPELADLIEQICGDKSWEGIIKKLWPKAKCISAISTGSMSQYVSLLEFYGGGVPLISPVYSSSESGFGININPLSTPFDISYTFLPNLSYFEFFPVNKDGGGNAREFELRSASATGSSEITNETRTVNEPVDLANVKLGQCYEVVVTTLTGKISSTHLQSYRLLIHSIKRHEQKSILPLVVRLSRSISIQSWRCSQEDLLKAITKAELILKPLGLMLATYSSYACTSSTPGRYILFWELKMKDSNGILTLDAKIMEQCCRIVEESFDFTYKSLRKADVIDALELRVVKRGTFDELMDFYVSKGASISQYKPHSCVKSEEAIKILNSGTVGKFSSPKTLF
ncbi:hypothetical protein V6N13_014267 [Hibiscus sabdariffa]